MFGLSELAPLYASAEDAIAAAIAREPVKCGGVRSHRLPQVGG